MYPQDFLQHRQQLVNFRLMFSLGYLSGDDFIARLLTAGFTQYEAEAELMEINEAFEIRSAA